MKTDCSFSFCLSLSHSGSLCLSLTLSHSFSLLSQNPVISPFHSFSHYLHKHVLTHCLFFQSCFHLSFQPTFLFQTYLLFPVWYIHTSLQPCIHSFIFLSSHLTRLSRSPLSLFVCESLSLFPFSLSSLFLSLAPSASHQAVAVVGPIGYSESVRGTKSGVQRPLWGNCSRVARQCRNAVDKLRLSS